MNKFVIVIILSFNTFFVFAQTNDEYFSDSYKSKDSTFYKEFKKWISLTEPSVFDIDLFFEGNRVVMILILSMRLYDIAIVSYDDREIAKREGFIWNPDEKTWIRNKYPLEYFENSDETFNSI